MEKKGQKRKAVDFFTVDGTREIFGGEVVPGGCDRITSQEIRPY